MDPIAEVQNRISSILFGRAVHKVLSQQCSKEYAQYLKLRGKKNKTKSQQQKCKALWKKLYRNNPKMKSLIHQEYRSALKVSDIQIKSLSEFL